MFAQYLVSVESFSHEKIRTPQAIHCLFILWITRSNNTGKALKIAIYMKIFPQISIDPPRIYLYIRNRPSLTSNGLNFA